MDPGLSNSLGHNFMQKGFGTTCFDFVWVVSEWTIWFCHKNLNYRSTTNDAVDNSSPNRYTRRKNIYINCWHASPLEFSASLQVALVIFCGTRGWLNRTRASSCRKLDTKKKTKKKQWHNTYHGDALPPPIERGHRHQCPAQEHKTVCKCLENRKQVPLSPSLSLFLLSSSVSCAECNFFISVVLTALHSSKRTTTKQNMWLHCGGELNRMGVCVSVVLSKLWLKGLCLHVEECIRVLSKNIKQVPNECKEWRQ